MPNCQGKLERYMNWQWSCRAKCWVTDWMDWMDWIPLRLSWLLKMLNMMKNENVLLVPHSWAWWGKVFFSSEAFPKISDLLALSCIRWASVKTQGRQHVFFFFLFFLDSMLIFWNAIDGSCTISILPNQFHMLMHKPVLLVASCYTRTRQRNNYLSFEWVFHSISMTQCFEID